MHIFPSVPSDLVVALHVWCIDEHDWINIPNVILLARLRRSSTPPSLPLRQLEVVAEVTVGPAMWKQDRRLNKHVLPVFADFLFQLQHNGLRFRYKSKHAHTDVHCVLCSDNSIETPKHLLHSASMLQLLQPLLAQDPNRSTTLFLHDFHASDDAQNRYGTRLLLTVFHIVRCSVLRLLWLARNQRRFQQAPVHVAGVKAQCLTAIRLQIRHYLAKISSSPSALPRAAQFRRHWTDVFPDSPLEG
ncbi:TPA: hypothetical protein N0F65_003489 [Lagenidium giganteum]|uniref:Uncharacterized protein n=1 Tax=Lagenidium giganteum TaxID=4803 RepID=A0AAV2YBX7_9STRA|nr:TPA: hypothetical protein N0F65_003489 [Lagenidium giganteum]